MSSHKKSNKDIAVRRSMECSYEVHIITIPGRVKPNQPAAWEQAWIAQLLWESEDAYEQAMDDPSNETLQGLGPKQQGLITSLINTKNKKETNSNAEWELFQVRRLYIKTRDRDTVNNALQVTIKRQVRQRELPAGPSAVQSDISKIHNTASGGNSSHERYPIADSQGADCAKIWVDKDVYTGMVESLKSLLANSKSIPKSIKTHPESKPILDDDRDRDSETSDYSSPTMPEGRQAHGHTSPRPNVTCNNVDVVFQVMAPTMCGEAIYVVGDHPKIGSWSPDKAIRLAAGEYTEDNPVWKGAISLPAGADVQYKFIKGGTDGTFTWEEAFSNRKITVQNDHAIMPLEIGIWR